jgi:RNA polymerase sigma-70 factor (ECF subfamily)
MNKSFSKYSDPELYSMLREKKSRAEAAFAELYARHNQRVYAYCLRVTGNQEEANDIFQDTFYKFFESAKTNRNIENVTGFLITITRNLCLNYKRDKKINLDLDNFSFSTNDTHYEEKEMLELIARALEFLDFSSREVFILRQYQGMSYKEIADITGDSAAAIKNRVWRAKEKIKEILEPYLEDYKNENKLN